jgi:hypothetical protein
MLEYIETIRPYLQLLSIILSISYTLYKFRKDRQMEKAEREKQLEASVQHENGIYPPRKDRHRKR